MRLQHDIALLVVVLRIIIKLSGLLPNLSHFNQIVSLEHQAINADHAVTLLPRLFLQLLVTVLLALLLVVLDLHLLVEDFYAMVEGHCEVEEYVESDQTDQGPTKLVAALLIRDVMSEHVQVVRAGQHGPLVEYLLPVL